MPVKERPLLKKTKPNRVVMALVALVSVLAVAVCSLTVFTVLRGNELTQAQNSLLEQQDAIELLEQQMQDASANQVTHESQLAEVQDQLKDAKDRIEKQEKELKEKDDTIASLQTEISQIRKTQSTNKKTTATLNQNLPNRYYGDYKGKKLVALTFDDGPGPYTERLLNEMKKRDVKATFFVLGNRVDRYPELIKRMEAEGHVVGNHSYDHPILTRLSAANVRSNMEKTAKKVEKLLGHKPEVMRCPGGACNSTVKGYAKDAGIPIIYWGVDTRDWESRNVNAIMKKAFGTGGIEDGSIVLMHDIHEPSVDAAIKMMDRLIDEGYTFVTVPELLMARDGKIEPGKVYV